MKKLTFEKYGLSPEKVEQLRAYKILPDKQTLKKPHQSLRNRQSGRNGTR